MNLNNKWKIILIFSLIIFILLMNTIQIFSENSEKKPIKLIKYKVEKGDTLMKIEDMYYTKLDKKIGAHWIHIYDYNVENDYINIETQPVISTEEGHFIINLKVDQDIIIPYYDEQFPDSEQLFDKYEIESKKSRGKTFAENNRSGVKIEEVEIDDETAFFNGQTGNDKSEKKMEDEEQEEKKEKSDTKKIDFFNDNNRAGVFISIELDDDDDDELDEKNDEQSNSINENEGFSMGDDDVMGYEDEEFNYYDKEFPTDNGEDEIVENEIIEDDVFVFNLFISEEKIDESKKESKKDDEFETYSEQKKDSLTSEDLDEIVEIISVYEEQQEEDEWKEGETVIQLNQKNKDSFQVLLKNTPKSSIKKRLRKWYKNGGSIDRVLKIKDLTADKLIEEAKKYLGVKYKYGGETSKSLDCSGLPMLVLSKFGVTIPHNAQMISKYGKLVPDKKHLKKGDFIFFTGTSRTKFISHMGIYIGDGEMIHASFSRGVTIDDYDNSYWKNKYVMAKRFIVD